MYPPASNKDYELTSDARDPKFIYKPAKPAPSPPKKPILGYPSRSVNEFTSKSPEETSADAAHTVLWGDKAIRMVGLGFPEAKGPEERVMMFKEAFNIQPEVAHEDGCQRIDLKRREANFSRVPMESPGRPVSSNAHAKTRGSSSKASKGSENDPPSGDLRDTCPSAQTSPGRMSRLN